jgi:hypothetical protein
LITQLEMTTSTLASGRGDVLEVAVDELDVVDAGLGGVGSGEVEHLVGHVEADGPASGGDAAGGDQDVGAGAGAEVEDRLAGVEVGDGGGDATAERRGHGGLGRAFGGLGVVEVGTEDDVTGLVGGRGDVGRAGGRLDAASVVVVAAGGAGGGVGVATSHHLSDVGDVGHRAPSEVVSQAGGSGTSRPMTTSAAEGKHDTHASLIRYQREVP